MSLPDNDQVLADAILMAGGYWDGLPENKVPAHTPEGAYLCMKANPYAPGWLLAAWLRMVEWHS